MFGITFFQWREQKRLLQQYFFLQWLTISGLFRTSNSFFHRYGLCLLCIILTCSCFRSFSLFSSLIRSLVHSFSSSLFSCCLFHSQCPLLFFYHDQVFINHKVREWNVCLYSCVFPHHLVYDIRPRVLCEQIHSCDGNKKEGKKRRRIIFLVLQSTVDG